MRVVWWLATVMAVGLISIVLSEQGRTDPIQNLSLRASSPLEGELRDIASPIRDLFQGITDRGELVRENQRLREELERLQGQAAAQQDLERRVTELQEALGVKQERPQDLLLGANVIAQEPSGLKRAIAIDRGLDDGIDEGMVVLSRNGSLVGTVSRVYSDFAWIRLITDPNSAVNAQVNLDVSQTAEGDGTPQVLIPETPAPQTSATPAPTATPAVSQAPASTAQVDASALRGVAEGDLRRGVALELLPSDSGVQEGDLVVTSGLGGNYPRAVLIGSVKKIEQRPQAPFISASVEPAANLSSLDTVLVLMSFKPARLTGP